MSAELEEVAKAPPTTTAMDSTEEMAAKQHAMVEISKLYQSSGCTGARLQTLLPKVFEAMGMPVSLLSAPNVLFIDFHNGGNHNNSRIVANKTVSLDCDMHEEITNLLIDIGTNPDSYSSEKLNDIVKKLQSKQPLYHVAVVFVAWLIVTTFVGSLYLRAPFAVAALACVGGVATFLFYAMLPAVLPSFAPSKDFIAAFIAGFLARGAASYELIELGCSVFGAVLSIVPMVPGSLLTTGIIDIMSGTAIVTGTSTFVVGIITAFLQGIGLWCGFYVGSHWGPTYVVPDDLTCSHDLTSDWWLFLWLPLNWASWAILLNVKVQRWPIYFGAGALMFGAWYGVGYTDAPSDFQNLLGSFVVGFFGFAVERFTGHPSIGVFVFGFFLQLPGASSVVAVWYSLYNQTAGYSSHAALVALEIGIGLYTAYGFFFAIFQKREIAFKPAAEYITPTEYYV